MKRAAAWPMVLLFALYALVPLCCAFGAAWGYGVTLRDGTAVLGVLAALSLALTAAVFHGWARANRLSAALLLPLSMVNGFCFLWDSQWFVTAILGMVCSGCAAALLFRVHKSAGVRAVCCAASVILSAGLLGASLLGSLFTDFNVRRVVRCEASPRGGYEAAVIDSDQGALGGNTLVEVRGTQSLNLGILRFTKRPVRVYVGDWGESGRMELVWKDEETLLINGTEYGIGK